MILLSPIESIQTDWRKSYLIVTQNDLIKQIAKEEDIHVATVRQVLRSAENIIFDHLSSTTPTENTVIKVFNGLSLECSYKPAREIDTFTHLRCDSRFRVKPKITRYYNRKLNSSYN